MISLSDYFKRYTGILRRVKAVYVLNNLLNADRLRAQRAAFRRYGLRRSVFAPLGSHNFVQPSAELPWLDRPDALERLVEHPFYLALTAAEQAAARQFVTDGYLVLPGFFDRTRVDALNAEVDSLLAAEAVGFNYTGRKIMDAHRRSAVVDGFFRDARLLEWLSFLLGRPVAPFQTINFQVGSEQRAHSDSIHMTTEPKGYLIAAWTALEPIGAHQGPLVYYPGTHRWPYVLAPDFESGNSQFLLGSDVNRRYEDRIGQLLAERNVAPVPFVAQPGDVFIWHANLLHGGSPITQPGATRRSMVAHYYAEGVICYHEMSQRPALLG